MYKGKSGFTLIETIVSMFIVGAVIVAGFKFIIDELEDSNYRNHAQMPIKIIKAVDRRIEIDGYEYGKWSSLPSADNTDGVLNFAQNAFISKNNPECGLSTGWEPELPDANNDMLIPCSFSKSEYKIYDYQLIKGENNEKEISFVSVVIKLKSQYSLDKDDYFLNHKKLLNIMKAGAPLTKKGNYFVDFYNESNLTESVDTSVCLSLVNNCVIKASWVSDGYSGLLAVNGSNNMIKDTVSFANTFYDEKRKCALWEYDDLGNYNLTSTQDCGIGVYNKTLRPVVANVDVAVDSSAFFKPVLLDKDCTEYKKDGAGFIYDNGIVPCGLYTSDNGVNNIIQIVDAISVDADYSDSNSTMIVDNLIVKELTADDLGISNFLQVMGTSNLNIVVVGAGATATFNDITKMDIINVLTKTKINGSLRIEDNPLLPSDALSVSSDLNLTGTLDADFTSDVNVVGDVLTGFFKVTEDAGLYNGKFCSYTENGEIGFDGTNVLICRESSISGVYKWSTGRVGEVAAFNGSCPTGWTPFNDAGGRTLLGNGRIFDLRTGDTTYQVGDTGGEAFVAMSESELAAHTHEYLDVMWSEHWGDTGSKNFIGDHGDQDRDNNWYTRQAITDKKGAGSAHENRTPYRTVRYCQFQEGDTAAESFLPPSSGSYWYPYPELFGDWFNVGSVYGCSALVYQFITGTNGHPDKEYWIRDCNQRQERIIQNREINYLTGVIRTTGTGRTESKTVSVTDVWIKDLPVYSIWVDVGLPFGCGSNPISIVEGSSSYTVVFQCNIKQERTMQEYLKQTDSDGNTTARIPWGPLVTEEQTIVKNYTFVVPKGSTVENCGTWSTYSSTNWTPNESGYYTDETVSQTRNVNQRRNCTTRGYVNGAWHVLDTALKYRVVNEARTVSGTKTRPVVSVVRAGCYMDTVAYDYATSPHCDGRAPRGSTKMDITFSVGDQQPLSNYSFKNPSDWKITWLSGCDTTYSNGSCRTIKTIYSSEREISARVQVENLITGDVKVYNITATGFTDI